MSIPAMDRPIPWTCRAGARTSAPPCCHAGVGISRDDIERQTRSLWRYRASLRLKSRHPSPWVKAVRLWCSGHGATCARSSSWSGSTPPAASRTGHGGHAVIPAPDRGGCRSGGQFRQWRLLRCGLWCRWWRAGENPRTRLYVAGQDRAGPRLWRRSATGGRAARGVGGGGHPAVRPDLLCQPQLATLLP